MVQHYSVGKEQKSSGLPSFIDCITSDLFNLVCAKNRETIVSDGGQ